MPRHLILATVIAVAMVLTLERDPDALKLRPLPYVLCLLFMWGLLAHFHWTRYRQRGEAGSRVFALVWGLHLMMALALALILGWRTLVP